MIRRVCPICDQVMTSAHYCRNCRSWVKNPWVQDVTYYLNERHPDEEAACEYHGQASVPNQARQQSAGAGSSSPKRPVSARPESARPTPAASTRPTPAASTRPTPAASTRPASAPARPASSRQESAHPISSRPVSSQPQDTRRPSANDRAGRAFINRIFLMIILVFAIAMLEYCVDRGIHITRYYGGEIGQECYLRADAGQDALFCKSGLEISGPDITTEESV
ncbi:MAG: hypothetical protein LIO81_06210 [Clostridiales bacterium]|nr:hypothetical protein [Clostridiales bacterium]